MENERSLNAQAVGVGDPITLAGRESQADVESSVPHFQALLGDLLERIAQVKATRDVEQLEGLRAEVVAHQTSLALLRRELDADPGPQIGDPVCAMLSLTWANVTESFRLYGNVLNSELEKISIRFDHCEADDSPSEEFKNEAEKYLRKEFETHASAMESDLGAFGDTEWRLVI